MARTQDDADVDAALFPVTNASLIKDMERAQDSYDNHGQEVNSNDNEDDTERALSLNETKASKHFFTIHSIDEEENNTLTTAEQMARKKIGSILSCHGNDDNEQDIGDEVYSNEDKADEVDKKPAGSKYKEDSDWGKSPQQDDSASSVDHGKAPTSSRSRSSGNSFQRDTTSTREAGTEIGSQVYAAWENGGWYFAEIVDIKRKPYSAFHQYSLLFYDGDFIEYASRKSFVTRQEYEKVFDKEIPVPPMAHQQRLRSWSSQKPSRLESHAVSSSMTLEELLENKCGECMNCTKDNCGRCASCVSHSNTQVCIQKMCCKVPVDEKAQPMPPGARFPDGWKFVIDPTMEGYCMANAPMKGAEGLKILPPTVTRGTYYSVERAKAHQPVVLRSVCPEILYAHIGAVAAKRSPTGRHNIEHDSSDDESALMRPNKTHRVDVISSDMIEPTANHFLVGRNFCFVWTNLNRQNKMLHGKVTECEQHADSGEIIGFKVTYNPKMREVLNSNNIGHWLAIQESHVLPPPLVLGGCILYEHYMQADNESSPLQSTLSTAMPFYWSWITADLSHEELVDSNYGEPLPRLTLMLRGFRLELNVKPSRIPNAGYGVFLSCTTTKEDASNDGTVDAFVLKAGELVDLGVYAPFRIQDKKLEAVTYAKNFVHSHKIEKWVFNANDTRYQLDITDDASGNLHAAAKSHIPAYVNESNDQDLVNIRAEHDPEGSVHYLLGHSIQSQGAFVVPADGSEVELYVNYGALYEKVRVRNGYSFVCDEELACIKKQISREEVEDVEEIDRFDEADVEACVNYFLMLFLMEEECKFSEEVVQRALICAVVLQRRACRLLKRDGSEYSPMERVRKKAGLLVSWLLDMVKDERDTLKMLQNTGEFDELTRGVFWRFFSEEELNELDKMMK